MSVSLRDRSFALLQYVLPKHLLSRFIYSFMRSRTGWLKNVTIRVFLRGYAVNMQEAVNPDPLAYASFNEFFTRPLKAAVRPLPSSPGSIVSPVDGTVSQSGRLEGDAIIQAKGHRYSVQALLGGDAAVASRYAGGDFACIYLAPYNYHRIHMPLAGRVVRTLYVPGDLFSVNAATVRTVPGLFARNERVVCEFAGQAGNVALVLVGALFVGSIETVWNGEVNPPPRRSRGVVDLPAGTGTELSLGAEVGRFNMGSTIVLLFEPGAMAFSPTLTPGTTVRMGEPIGRVLRQPQP